MIFKTHNEYYYSLVYISICKTHGMLEYTGDKNIWNWQIYLNKHHTGPHHTTPTFQNFNFISFIYNGYKSIRSKLYKKDLYK